MSKETFEDLISELGIEPPTKKSSGAARQFAVVLPPDTGDDEPFINREKHVQNGVDPRRLADLLKEEPEDSIDLHGMTAAVAHEEVEAFLQDQIKCGNRHVEIVHGKGVHTPDGRAVLRTKVRKWLSGCEAVLGYTTASRNLGAMHVLLRRK